MRYDEIDCEKRFKFEFDGSLEALLLAMYSGVILKVDEVASGMPA